MSASHSSLAGLRVVVMGLGQFGGGVGVTRFLAGQGAKVLVTDKEPESKLLQSKAKLADLNVTYRLGEHVVSDFTGADLIVVNPAVNPTANPFLIAARESGVPLTSEIRLLVERLPNRLRTIGITGSAGKSTTTSMVGHVLERVKRSEFRIPSLHLGGNLGGSLLNTLDTIQPDDWVVLELSSFMLEGLREDRWSPHVALVTNLSPNHLDWHGSFESYRHAKQALLDFQREDDIAILGPGADGLMPRVAQANQHLFHQRDMEALTRNIPPLLIPGYHNRINAAMAVAVCVAAGVEREAAMEAVAGFGGLPHRLQCVHEKGGIRYFNDSKCTTPEAAMLALQSFPPGVVHLILGGYDKESDLSPLAAFAKQHCRSIHTVGVTGPAIASAAEQAIGNAKVFRSETLARAMQEVSHLLAPGDVVLLSPACASWDQFTNYEARGAAFTELARQP